MSFTAKFSRNPQGHARGNKVPLARLTGKSSKYRKYKGLGAEKCLASPGTRPMELRERQKIDSTPAMPQILLAAVDVVYCQLSVRGEAPTVSPALVQCHVCFNFNS